MIIAVLKKLEKHNKQSYTKLLQIVTAITAYRKLVSKMFSNLYFTYLNLKVKFNVYFVKMSQVTYQN